MIDPYLLEQFVVFSETGTLAETAQRLMITQPSVTRNMQKLEDLLGVTLFERKPNKIHLTQTGQLAATEAKKLLASQEAFIQKVQAFEYSQQHMTLTSVAPGPLFLVKHLPKEEREALEWSTDLLPPEKSEEVLLNHRFSLVISHQEIQSDQIESFYLGTESLEVNLDPFTQLASQSQVTFQDLKGMSFVVLTDIGIWKKLIQEAIPEAKFLYQEDLTALSELTQYSAFPFFSTNLSPFNQDPLSQSQGLRKKLPITDETASVAFYATYLKANKSRLLPLLKCLQTIWQKGAAETKTALKRP